MRQIAIRFAICTVMLGTARYPPSTAPGIARDDVFGWWHWCQGKGKVRLG